MATSPASSLHSGDPPIEGGHLVANLTAAALVAPALIWSSGMLYRRIFGGHRRYRHALPLPISHAAAESNRIAGEMPKSLAIVEDVVQHTLSNLHSIHKILEYWQSRAEETDSQLLYFMMFERGPEAFVEETCQALTSLRSNGSPSQYLLNSAFDMFRKKITALQRMQRCLAVFLSKVYSEVDTFRERLTESSDQSLRTLISVMDFVFAELEASFRNARNILSTHDGNIPVRLFKTLPEVRVGTSEAVTESAISLIYENLQELDSFVSCEISSHRKPRNITIYWLPYTFGAIGLSACSLWLLSHSSLMGGSDIDTWIHDAKESVAIFWDVHVTKPIQKHRLDLQQSMVKLDQIVKANRMNFAMLAALPTFGLSLLLLLPDQGTGGKGRIARRKRRLHLIQAEQRLMEFMRCKANGMDEEACCQFGLAVYALDRLYNAVAFHAKKTGEWSRVREEIFQLSMPSMGMEYKKSVLSRLQLMYECLRPAQHL